MDDNTAPPDGARLALALLEQLSPLDRARAVTWLMGPGRGELARLRTTAIAGEVERRGYRGAASAVARELGVSRQQVSDAVRAAAEGDEPLSGST